jgi:hypothetical protein
MQRRTLFSIVNLGVAAGVLLVFFLFPRYAGYAVYAFLAWFLVGLSMIWLARGSAPVAGPGPLVATPAAAGGALPSAAPVRKDGGTPSPPPEVGFCIFCATDLAPDADRCPACGHLRARFG